MVVIGSLRTPAAIRLAGSHILSSVMLKPTSTLVEQRIRDGKSVYNLGE
jgi:hypothetical protein